MIVFEWLKIWFEHNDELLKERNITFSFSELITETSNPSQYVNIDTETQMARASLWKMGECDFEIIKDETSNIIFWGNRTIKTSDELNGFLRKGFSKL